MSPVSTSVSIGGNTETPSPFLPSNSYTGPAPTPARNVPLASTQLSPPGSASYPPLPALRNTGRGAHIATSSCESTGRSFQFSGPAYFKKFPAIQWYSSIPATFSTISPQFRRCSFAPPSPDELTYAVHIR